MCFAELVASENTSSVSETEASLVKSESLALSVEVDDSAIGSKFADGVVRENKR